MEEGKHEKEGLLSLVDRRKIVDDALATSEQTNEYLLTKIAERFAAVGYEPPQVEVRFENLAVEADVFVGDRALPTLINSTRNTAESLLVSLGILRSPKREFPILHSISGLLKPGRLTLLLGPPGAGKSTLLKALSGKLDSELRSQGSITYNGSSLKEFTPQRTAVYVAQDDVLIGEMTVRETLDFSARVQGPGFRPAILAELEKKERDQGIKPDPVVEAFMKAESAEALPNSVDTELMLRVLGLDVCADTIVGNKLLRGISGGQKKRVTSAEQLVGPRTVLFLDEISTGLDSSTTYQITKSLMHLTHKMKGTTMVALLQPPPETYDLFDDILLLSEGHLVYHGPREQVLPFFEHMGFKPPKRKATADFLQEVTSIKDQGQYRIGLDRRKKLEAPYIPVMDFAKAFQEYPIGQANIAALKEPFDRSKSSPFALDARRYGIPLGKILKAATENTILLMKRNAVFYIASSIQIVIIGSVLMTLFLRTTLDRTVADGTYYQGAIFFGSLMMLFNGLAEMSILVDRLPIFFKARDNLFVPAWCFSLPGWFLTIPFSVWSAFLYSVLTYFVIGLAPEAGRFFRYLLMMFLTHQMSVSLFRLIGALGRSMTVANTLGGFGLLAVLVLGGFVVAKDAIHPWWIWGFWCSPLSYATNAFMINEFGAKRWQTRISDTFPFTVGETVLHNRGLFQEDYRYWVAVGALIGFTVLFNLVIVTVLKFFQPIDKPQPVVSEQFLVEKEAVRTGVGAEKFKPETTHKKPEGKQQSALGQISTLAQQSALQQGSALGQGSGLGQYSGLGMYSHVSEGNDDDLGEIPSGGMEVLPFTPLALTFNHVNYYVALPAEMKDSPQATKDGKLQLLNNVSGAFRPGILTALVGVSGAGKTTLMDVLAGRKTGGVIEGDIRVSGYPKKQETFARIAGYCEQNDIHSPQVTVEESLLYSAWLRLPASFKGVDGKEIPVDAAVRKAFVDEVMNLVELNSLKDALVGQPGVTGLSTEQRKRLTIAVELVANPSIIFMDEPTSGLDARAAAIVMRTVKNIVRTRRTIVCTIHQPSIDIFEAFDELVLMKRGGKVIYSGALGRQSTTLVDYFESIPGVPKIKEGANPATWMLEISTPAAEEQIAHATPEFSDFAEQFSKSTVYQRTEEIIQELSTPPPGQEDLHFPSQYSQSWPIQFVACFWKWRQTYWRTPQYNAVRMFFTFVVALLIGTIFWGFGKKRDTQKDVYNVMGALYVVSLFLGWNNAASVQPVVFLERPVFYRERAAGMYSALPYTLAQAVLEIPYILVQSIMYSLMTYAMIQFEWTVEKYLWYNLFTFLTLVYFCFYGLMAIAITPNEQLAAVVSAFFFSLWNLFSGFLIPRPSMPGWWRWYYWLDPVAWTLYGLIGSQLGDVDTPIQVFGSTKEQSVKEFVGDFFGYRHDWLGYVVIVLIGWALFFWVIYAYALKNLVMQSR